MLLLYILLALLGQQTTVNGQQTPFLESENLKTSESEKSCEQQTISNETFFETEKSVNISEICGNEKTNHKLVQKKSEKSCEPRAMSNETFFESENLKTSESEKGSEPRAMSYEPFLESENLKTSKSEKGQKIFQVFNFSDSQIQKDSQVFNFSDSQIQKDSQVFNFSDSQIQKDSQVFSFSDSQILYFENQIRLADSLYKNYLPQYNFEEVKAAVMFFDSCQSSAVSRQPWRLFNKKVADENKLIADRRLLTAAKAHYYHAVGLTERDDIVGACEHYFIALEIMESEIENLKTSKSGKGSEQRAMSHEQKFQNAHSSKLEAQSTSQFFSFSDSQILNNPEDYEKIRFLSLIYTRLGELFLSENYCDLAISKYRKALRYVLLLGENKAVANTYKCLGNSYHLYDMPDSALYYYNKSLETNSELPNRLDVEKCIAQILFDRGEKDSAYVMIKNNLDKIEDYSSKDSYYAVLGDMYYKDMEYDSAIFYLEKSILNHDYYIKHLSSTNLSAIYDSNGDYDKKVHYDNIISRLSVKKIDESIENNKLQSVYDNYKERKYERERIEYIREKRQIIISLSGIVFFVLILALLIMYKSKRKESVFSTSMSEMKKAIIDKDTMIGRTNEEIKQKDSVIKRYSQEIEDNKKIIDILRKDIETNKQEISNMEANVKKLKKDLSDNETKL